jgi:hypothetical protein
LIPPRSYHVPEVVTYLYIHAFETEGANWRVNATGVFAFIEISTLASRIKTAFSDKLLDMHAREVFAAIRVVVERIGLLLRGASASLHSLKNLQNISQ